MDIQFIPVTAQNYDQIMRLQIKESQKGFIETVQQCLQEAEQLSLWRPVGIYVDQRLIGFAMYGLWEKEGENGRVWMDRFLIDWKQQGKGYASACFPSLMERIKKEYGCGKVYLSVIEQNKTAVHLYQKYGFRFNGETDIHGEKVMVWEKPPAGQ